MNLYGFCLNQPTNGIDIKGELLWIPVIIIVLWLTDTAVAPESEGEMYIPPPKPIIPPTPDEYVEEITGIDIPDYSPTKKKIAKTCCSITASQKNKMKKLLSEFDRLMQKLNKKMPEKRVKELKEKGDNIKASDLPGSIQNEWPCPELKDTPLSEIKDLVTE
jgi:hypothetical protein